MINFIGILKDVTNILSYLICLQYFGGETLKNYQQYILEWWSSQC